MLLFIIEVPVLLGYFTELLWVNEAREDLDLLTLLPWEVFLFTGGSSIGVGGKGIRGANSSKARGGLIYRKFRRMQSSFTRKGMRRIIATFRGVFSEIVPNQNKTSREYNKIHVKHRITISYLNKTLDKRFLPIEHSFSA